MRKKMKGISQTDAVNEERPEVPAAEGAALISSGGIGSTRAMRFLWIVPLLLAALVYVRLYTAEYVWDDLIVQEVIAEGITSAKDAFFPPKTPEFSSYYRPVVLLSSLWEQRAAAALFGAGPMGGEGAPPLMHTINILVHVGTTGFVYLLAALLLASLPFGRIGALIAATWFAVHPIHVEPVAWISGRTDLYATFFLLGAVFFAARFVQGGRRTDALLAAVILLLGLFSKENAAAYVLFMPVVVYALCRTRGRSLPGRREWLWLAAPALAAFAVYYILRIQTATLTPYGAPEAPVTLGNILSVYAYYVLRCVWPWPQTPYAMMANMPSPVWAFVILAAAALLAVIVYRHRELPRSVFAAGAAWTFLPMAPGLIYLLRPAGTIVAAERVDYMPTVGVALMLAALTAHLMERPRLRISLLAACAVVLIAYTVGSYRQSLIWRNDLVFWEDNIQKPELYRDKAANMFLAYAYLSRGRFDESEKWYRHMLHPEVAGPAHLNWKGQYGLVRSLVMGAQSKLAEGRYSEAAIKAEEAVRVARAWYRMFPDGPHLLAAAQDILARAGRTARSGSR